MTALEYIERYAEEPDEGLEPFDDTDLARRCDQVADRHLRTKSPEFVTWLDGRLDTKQQAELVAAVLGGSDIAATRANFISLREAWRDYVYNVPRELRSEISREP